MERGLVSGPFFIRFVVFDYAKLDTSYYFDISRNMEITDIDSLSEVMVGRLAALASGHRLAVFKALVRAGNSGLSAGEIARRLKMPPSSLSFHLAHLSNEGLVQSERQGRSIIYRADFSAMESLVRYLFEECCAEGCDPLPRSAQKGIEA